MLKLKHGAPTLQVLLEYAGLYLFSNREWYFSLYWTLEGQAKFFLAYEFFTFLGLSLLWLAIVRS